MSLIGLPSQDVAVVDSEKSIDLKDKIRRARIARQQRDKKLKALRNHLGIRLGVTPVERSEVNEFLEIATTNKDKAVEILILNSFVSEYSKKSVSFQLLSTLGHNTEIRDMKRKQQVAIIETIADAADEMFKIAGAIPQKLYDIFRISKALSARLLESMSPVKREKVLLKILRKGKADSWLVYFARMIILEHEIGSTAVSRFDPWLENEILEQVKVTTLERLNKVMNQHFTKLANPLQVFLCWLHFGSENDKEWLREWVRSNTRSNEELVNFIEIYTGMALVRNGTPFPDDIKIAYTDTISTLVEIDEVVERLQCISKCGDELGKKSNELLGLVEYSLSARERGLEIISRYR